jgi:hypothetical protein
VPPGPPLSRNHKAFQRWVFNASNVSLPNYNKCEKSNFVTKVFSANWF